MENIKQLNSYTDNRGTLVSCEGEKDIPFNIKRVFFIHSIPVMSRRGGHAHLKSKQFIVSVNGSFNIQIINKNQNIIFNLNNPNHGIFLPELTWVNLSDFTASTTIMVLTDTEYDKNDYINNFNNFLELIK